MAMIRHWSVAGAGKRRLHWIALTLRECWAFLSAVAMEHIGSDAPPHAPTQSQQTHALGEHSGQNEDFETFYRRFERELFSYLWRITNEEQAAYDLSQETFLRAWQHFSRIRAYEQPAGWLFRVATNLALNHLRQQASFARRSHTLSLEASEALRGGDVTASVVEGDAVRRALMLLAPRQRSALVLREVYGLTCHEVAQALGISHGAAKTLLWRTRDEFRERYMREEQLS